jgi:hypothetical protein
MKQRRIVKRLVTTAVLFTLMGIHLSWSQEELDSGVVFFFEAEETDKFYGCAHCYTPDYFGDQYSGGQGPGLCYPLGFVDFLPVPRGKTLIVGYGNGKAASNGVTITINNEAVINPDSLEPEKWPKHKWWFHLSEEVHGELVVDVSEYLTLDSNLIRIQHTDSAPDFKHLHTSYRLYQSVEYESAGRPGTTGKEILVSLHCRGRGIREGNGDPWDPVLCRCSRSYGPPGDFGFRGSRRQCRHARSLAG